MIITTEEGSKILAAVEDEIAETKRLTAEAEFYILNFASEVRSYKARKLEYLSRQMDDNSGIRSSGPGRPTESSAMKSLKFDSGYAPLRWLKAVEVLKKSLGERKNIFIRVRVEAAGHDVCQGKGRPGWVGYVRKRYSEELEKRFLVREDYSDATIKGWWRGIINQAVALYKKTS